MQRLTKTVCRGFCGTLLGCCRPVRHTLNELKIVREAKDQSPQGPKARNIVKRSPSTIASTYDSEDASLLSAHSETTEAIALRLHEDKIAEALSLVGVDYLRPLSVPLSFIGVYSTTFQSKFL